MEKLTVLGTGHASVTKCYNTCFTVSSGEEHFLVDAGGGNGILVQLEKSNIDISNIHNMFVSHNHTDHLLGVIWMIRMIAQRISRFHAKYDGNFNLYCSQDTANAINTIAKVTLPAPLYNNIGDRIKIIVVKNREKVRILENEIEFIDVQSKKDLQYGFIATLNNNRKLVFLGDEPYCNQYDDLIQDCDWLLTEAFCLYSERDIFKPYEKFHSTAKDAAEIANKFNVKNLLLWHTEDKNIENRKELYTNEAKQCFNGNIFVPDDLEVIQL